MTDNHDNWMQKWREQQRAKEMAAKKKLSDFCGWLETHYPAIHSIEARYYGAGDSGSVEGVFCYGKDGEEIATPFMEVFKQFDKNIDEDWQVDNIIMENLPFDWVNNEGGCGVATIHVADRELHYDHQQREFAYHDVVVKLEDEDRSPLEGQSDKDSSQDVEGR